MRGQYYSASEARARLGLSKSMFFRKVKQGLIPKVVLPGMTQGMYPARDIEALALSINVALEDFAFSHSSPADLMEELNIDVRSFGREFSIPLVNRIAFQQKSNFTYHSLKVHGAVVGYISMFRLTDEVCEALLAGRTISVELTPRDVFPFIRLQPFHIFIDRIVVDPQLPLRLRRFYSGLIVTHTLGVIHNLLMNDYQITHLYVVTVNEGAEKLVRRMGFVRIEGKSIIPGHVAYQYTFDADGLYHLASLQKRYHTNKMVTE